MLSLKCKINLNTHQELVLNTLSNEHRLLYNTLLRAIKDKTMTFKELNELYRVTRIEQNLTINSKSAQNTCINLINNIKSFYALHKKDITAKFPYKFKSYKYFTSFMHDYNHGSGGFKLINSNLELNLLNNHKLVIVLPNYCSIITKENIKTITFIRENNQYYIVFVYGEKPSNCKLDKSNFVSIDLGYTNLLTTYSNKIDNISVKNIKLKKLVKQVKVLQSIKDKKLKNSKKFKNINKKFNRVKNKISNKVKDYQHKVSSHLINELVKNDIGSLIIGDIKVKKIISKENKKLSGISKSTASLGRFKTILEYKAKKVNIDFYSVNEAYTSQQNCITDQIMFSSDLSNRVVEVSKDLFINRDLNSAINIAKKVKGIWFTHDLNFSLNEIYYDIKSDSMKNNL